MSVKFSFIVPVYNVEKYLDKCVTSLLRQTYSNIEIILVNDGSTDNCKELCNKYSENNSQIQVIHKINGGLSDARNWGLRSATGDYVIFVDSDDYIEENSCELFEAYTKDKIDVLIGNAKRITKDNTEYMKHSYADPMQYHTGKEILKHELINHTMYMAAWQNVYRRDFLIENELFFKVGILHEDEQWTPRVLLNAESAVITNILFYNYIIRENSITQQKDRTQNAIDLMNTVKDLSVIYDNLEDVVLKEQFNNYLVMLYLSAFYIGRMYRKEYKDYIDKEFLKARALNPKNLKKVRLFCLNTRIYYYINRISKIFK